MTFETADVIAKVIILGHQAMLKIMLGFAPPSP